MIENGTASTNAMNAISEFVSPEYQEVKALPTTAGMTMIEHSTKVVKMVIYDLPIKLLHGFIRW